MGEQISVPTGDGTFSQWIIVPTSPTTHFDKVDESWLTPNTSDYISATTDFRIDKFTFPADGPADMALVHTIHTDLYLNTVNVTQIPGLQILIFLNTTFHTQKQFQIDTGGTWQKRRFTIDGLSLTKAQYNTVRIGILTNAGSPTDEIPTVTP